jgi:MFS family permease
MILSPLAADMFDVVEQMGKDNEGLFGPAGAYAQAYGLFEAAIALGTMFGPTYAGLMYEKAGWQPVVWALAVFCASGSIPVVRFFPMQARNLSRSTHPFLY